MTNLKVRPITQFSELAKGMLYHMTQDMPAADAARLYEAKYGCQPAEVLTFGPWNYIALRPFEKGRGLL